MLDTQAAYLYTTLDDDPEVAEIVEMFVAEMPERIARLHACADQGDREGLRRLAHQMKGACGSYGFQPLTVAAGRLEQAVREGRDESSILAALEELSALGARVRAK